MYQSTVIAYEPIKSLDSSTLAGSYLSIGSPLINESRILKIVNTSNTNITISTNGSSDMDVVPAGGFVLYDNCTNRTSSSPVLCFPKGTQFFAKGSAGSGLIYLVSLYAQTPTETIPL